MRRVALTFVLAAALALLIPLGSSGAPATVPEKARSWLGTWDTASGKLYFYDVYRKRSGNASYWAAEGRWDRPGKGWTKIWGALNSKDLLTFQGEWKLSKSDPRYEFGEDGSALIYRSDDGERISGGFWKACPLQQQLGPNCGANGHWGKNKGEVKDSAWKVGFRATQRGYPDGKHAIRTQTGVAGSLIFKDSSIHKNRRGDAAQGSKVFMVEEIRDAADLHLEVELILGFYKDPFIRPTRRATVRASGFVTKSDDPHCKKGEPARVVLTQGYGGVPDQIQLYTTCGSDTWTSANPERVSVHVEKPHEIK